MRKLVRTVIINDDEDEDDDEMSIHHRHHHVSRVLVPRGLRGVKLQSGWEGAQHHTGSGIQDKSVGKLLWKQQHERSQQTSGIWRRFCSL